MRRSFGEDSYTIRFTPRRAGSIWSNVNCAKVAALLEAGRMMPAGLAAWERRDPEKSGIYVFERKNPVAFDAGAERRFNRAAPRNRRLSRWPGMCLSRVRCHPTST